MHTGPKIGKRSAAFLDRHGRLLILCGLSVLLHAALIAWLDLRLAAPPAPARPPALAVKLARAPAMPAAPATPAAPAAPAEQQALPAPPPAAAAPPEDPPAAPDPAPRADAASLPAAPGGELFQMPSRYRVAVAPSVTLVYEVLGASGPAGVARLRWETDGVRYRMAMDGILGAIDSEGATDDAGIAPLRAGYRSRAGSAAVAFERERRTIVFESVGRSARDMPGSQDGATLLMQLAGIGLADPDQMQGTLEIQVGRADGATVERFQVLGRENLATALGEIETLRLARSGGTALEIWLAPRHGWLPVQLRTTAPDGSMRTQVVKEIQGAPAG